MRRLLAALLLAVSPAALHAAGVAVQRGADTASGERPAHSQPSREAAPAEVAGRPESGFRDRPASAAEGAGRPGVLTGILARLARLEQRMPWSGIPMVRDVPAGPRVVAAGDTATGPVASRGGPLDVYGVINGDAVAYEGDVILHPGAVVTGDAIAVLGRVRLLGGAVGGEVRSVRGALAPAVSAQATAATTTKATVRDRLGLVVGWLTVLILIGVGVLVFASRPLDGVVEALHGGFARSLLLGVAGQLAVLPALLLVVVALAVTVIGILLIPFAIVAITLATAGLMMLGFLAVSRVTGGAITGGDSRGRLSERGAVLRALFVGIVLFVAVWLAAALLTPVPIAAAVARGVAFVLTWVAVTAGFGAALHSRAGTRRPAPPELAPEPEEEISWLTPTPIGGVAEVRRPSSPTRWAGPANPPRPATERWPRLCPFPPRRQRGGGMRLLGYRVETVAKSVFRESLEDNVLGLAAQTAYYFFFSLFPLLLFLTPLFSLVDDKQRFMDFLMGQFGRALPPESFQLFRDIVASVVYSDAAPGLMSVGAILALWAGSNIFNSLIGALNTAYDVQETRPWWKTRLIAIAMVLLSGAVIVLSTITLLAGQDIVASVARLVGLDEATASAITLVQYTAALLLMLGVGFLTYVILPCVRQHRLHALAGAILATILWVTVTLAFRFYVVNFADYNKTYGTIGGVIVLLTWMYLSMVVLLVGGELNSELHKGTGRLVDRGGTLLGGRVSPGGSVSLPSVDRVVRTR